MVRLPLHTARDVQTSLAAAARDRREARGYSRAALARLSTVPAATIKRFETTGQISLRQFLLIWQCVDRLERVASLCDLPPSLPQSIDEVLADDRADR
ncbi:MAG: helix-turn-helix domain-containing protein [Gammaproteobacteria bacterium]|nr:helix-turn-helix domain-containing protein [Gammaproteobacteria bacterium]